MGQADGGAGGAGGGTAGAGPSDFYSQDALYASERPEHAVTVGDYRLDAFEVTVGRFRAFVNDPGLATAGSWEPGRGVGANELVGAAVTGWDPAWSLPTSVAAWQGALACEDGTWTETAGDNEVLPINCVTWFEAFAFCAWDGGRLPTEAEWEYAAAGGDENRLYPWGTNAPTCTVANHTNCVGHPSAVGSHSGRGRWGHFELGGNVMEWTLDSYAEDYYPGETALNPVNLTNTGHRTLRGGYYLDLAHVLRSARRGMDGPGARGVAYGVRCARAAADAPSSD